MSKTVAVHSFRGGTGKSNLTANLAVEIARRGQRVAVMDTDIQSPGIHVILGLDGKTIDKTLNDYLMGREAIEQVIYDVGAGADLPPGRLLLIPSSMELGRITHILKEGYSVALLSSGIKQLATALSLDVLLIDTHPGLNEETLFSFTIADLVLVVMRPDRQDYQGTSITLEAARRLKAVSRLVVNNISPSLDVAEVRRAVEEAYGVPVVAAIPHYQELMDLGSADVVVSRHPDHPFSQQMRVIADCIADSAERN